MAPSVGCWDRKQHASQTLLHNTGKILVQKSCHLRFAVGIVPVIDKGEQQPDAILGSLIQDVVQSLECMLTVFAYRHNIAVKSVLCEAVAAGGKAV